MSERLNLIVDDGIGELMTVLAGGERRRGQWLSDLVRAVHENQANANVGEAETLRLAFAGLAGAQRMVEGRVQRLEAQVAALLDAKA